VLEANIPPDDLQDTGGRQDNHAEKDVAEIQRGSGQDVPACRCPLEQEDSGTTSAMTLPLKR
jgi:hypothetical protein